MNEISSLMVHVDVDAFFASVEQLLVPSLRGRPVIVGSGVIASCSYEARAMGLRAGMTLHEAKKLCPQAVILAGDCQIYRCFAEHVWDVCRRFTCGLETFLDEAYGDATGILSYGGPLDLGGSLRGRPARGRSAGHRGTGRQPHDGQTRIDAAKPGGTGIPACANEAQSEMVLPALHGPARRLAGPWHPESRPGDSRTPSPDPPNRRKE